MKNLRAKDKPEKLRKRCNDLRKMIFQFYSNKWHLIIDTLSLPLPLLAPSCAQRLATLSNTFAQAFSFNHLQAKSTCLKKRSKHRNSGRIPSLIGSLTPAHGRLSRNMINNFCKRIISHPVKSQYLKYLKPFSRKTGLTASK